MIVRTAWASLAPAVPLAGLLLAVPCPSPGQSSASQVNSLLQEAQGALQSEDYEAARRFFEQAAAADPRSPAGSCGLGQVNMALRRYEEAVRSLEDCRNRILAQLRQAQAEQARAFGSIDTEIREVGETIQAIRSGRIHGAGADRITHLEARIRELEQMKTRDPVQVEVPPEVAFALGTAYLHVGRLDEAERELLGLLRRNPDSGEAHNNLAAVYLAQARFEEASERVRLAEESGARVNPKLKADIAARRSPGLPSGAPPPRAAATRPEDEPIAIQHAGRTCAAKGLFVQVEVTVTPSWGVHDPIVRFRSEERSGWYSMTMLPAGGDTFATRLPRPRGAESFEYFIEVSSYDETETRTDDFRVSVVKKPEDCAEAATDSEEAGGVLIVDVPRDVAEAPPVPPGFSIRGTTADIGVLELGSNKSLIAGGIAAGGAVAAGIAVASQPPEPYSGPQPFVEANGVAFLSSDPPPGSTLSLSNGFLALRLDVFSVKTLTGARITADLIQTAGPDARCFVLEGSHDLPAGQRQTVVLSGPTLPDNDFCTTDRPITEIRVRVVGGDGFGGFHTGIAPLNHLRVEYFVAE
jgi:tetratricopeptide (TPR) repeat protein